MWKKSNWSNSNDRLIDYAKDEMKTLLQDWDRCLKRYRNYRRTLCGVLSLSLLILGGLEYHYLYNQIPSRIHIRAGQEELIDLGIPAKGQLLPSGFAGKSNIPEGAVTIDFSQPVTLKADELTEYSMEVKLFGLFPMKTVDIQVIEKQEIIPVGQPIGIYLETEGILVVGVGDFINEEGKSVSPSKSLLQSGDYIHAVNGHEVNNKREVVGLVADCHGEDMELTVKRGEEFLDITVVPDCDSSGTYKIGVWLRDNTQGVGTLTYVEVDGGYGALGHSIADVDTGQPLALDEGILYGAEIVGVEKGVIGDPGELTGYISYTDSNMLGTVDENSEAGIYGELNEKARRKYTGQAIPIGFKQEIQRGDAQILTTIENETRCYNIRITGTNQDNANVNRGIEFTVTDKELLELTGGIVQGMSGSPILQNGKIIGAVTHVLINDPSRGYGIFIENMLEH